MQHRKYRTVNSQPDINDVMTENNLIMTLSHLVPIYSLKFVLVIILEHLCAERIKACEGFVYNVYRKYTGKPQCHQCLSAEFNLDLKRKSKQ